MKPITRPPHYFQQPLQKTRKTTHKKPPVPLPRKNLLQFKMEPCWKTNFKSTRLHARRIVQKRLQNILVRLFHKLFSTQIHILKKSGFTSDQAYFIKQKFKECEMTSVQLEKSMRYIIEHLEEHQSLMAMTPESPKQITLIACDAVIMALKDLKKDANIDLVLQSTLKEVIAPSEQQIQDMQRHIIKGTRSMIPDIYDPINTAFFFGNLQEKPVKITMEPSWKFCRDQLIIQARTIELNPQCRLIQAKLYQQYEQHMTPANFMLCFQKAKLACMGDISTLEDNFKIHFESMQ